MQVDMDETKKGLQKGHHCFKCIHYVDYYFVEPDGGFAEIRFECGLDSEGKAPALHHMARIRGPEKDVCGSFEWDYKYLEFRRKLYGR